jgi:hypothetical protein
MKKIIFILSAIACIYTTACKNNPQPSQAEKILKEAAKNQSLNISRKEYVVNVPAGWREIDTSIQGIKAYIIYAPEDGSNVHSNLNIVNESMKDYSLDDYVKADLNTIQSSIPSYKELGQGDFETDSHVKAKWIHSSYIMNGFNLESIQYIIPIDGIAYALTGTSATRNFDKYKNDFDTIAKSFHLK